MLRVEEAGHSTFWKGCPDGSGAHAGQGIATGGQRVGDGAQFVRAAQPRHLLPGYLGGLQSLLVVRLCGTIELMVGQLLVEATQLLTGQPA